MNKQQRKIVERLEGWAQSCVAVLGRTGATGTSKPLLVEVIDLIRELDAQVAEGADILKHARAEITRLVELQSQATWVAEGRDAALGDMRGIIERQKKLLTEQAMHIAELEERNEWQARTIREHMGEGTTPAPRPDLGRFYALGEHRTSSGGGRMERVDIPLGHDVHSYISGYEAAVRAERERLDVSAPMPTAKRGGIQFRKPPVEGVTDEPGLVTASGAWCEGEEPTPEATVKRGGGKVEFHRTDSVTPQRVADGYAAGYANGLDDGRRGR